MKIITEAELRDRYKQAEFDSFKLPAGTRLTPSAREFLNERRISVVTEAGLTGSRLNKPESGRSTEEVYSPDGEKGFTDLATGETISQKPETMTHLRGRYLVPKNDSRIKFRGRLDSLEALLIITIIEVEGHGYRSLGQELTDLLQYCRQVMGAEVKEEPLPPLTYRGMSQEEIREHSHYPEKYYGISHILPGPGYGRPMARLNLLRTQCREVELAAVEAFNNFPDGGGRPDILLAMNRLSSLVYVMMLQLASGVYKAGS